MTKSTSVWSHVEIENIEQMRLEQGIDDTELREEVQRLRVGDLVNLTFLVELKSETLAVRITSINGRAYRGKLAPCSAATGLAKLGAGELITFRAGHIHSLPKGQPIRRH